ncbi:high affinity immunoglobulin epsilon receptor subunit alpha-like, partial [Haplochromis burtoni]|uniref:high affinity immunoglobulin epsilon receptor subunit alpha-like n=1 Tax=Haplochromis burtoni TaxID=8153 RepID=UPI001C2CEE38
KQVSFLIAFFLEILVTDAVFPHIVPNRLQFFEYKSVSVHCEEDNNATEWSVKWNSSYTSSTSPSPYTIYPTFESHSGEYWCENEHGIKSEAVNITITAGVVILESPTYHVKEGNEVIFNCKNKKTQSEHITDFYKDGVSLGTWYQNSMTIKNVSKSDEGLYKCSISGVGESPESWLAVIKQREAYEETGLSQSLFPETLNLLWTVICVLLVDLSLVVLGLLYQNKHKVSTCFSLERNSCTHEDDK